MRLAHAAAAAIAAAARRQVRWLLLLIMIVIMILLSPAALVVRRRRPLRADSGGLCKVPCQYIADDHGMPELLPPEQVPAQPNMRVRDTQRGEER